MQKGSRKIQLRHILCLNHALCSGNKLNDRISEWWPVKQTLTTRLSSETVSVTLLGNLRLVICEFCHDCLFFGSGMVFTAEK